eukprot:scaffold115958_cov42-Phaeocystis_antarctica.AAC.3
MSVTCASSRRLSSTAASSQPVSRCDWPPSEASQVASCTSAGSRPASAASLIPADACVVRVVVAMVVVAREGDGGGDGDGGGEGGSGEGGGGEGVVARVEAVASGQGVWRSRCLAVKVSSGQGACAWPPRRTRVFCRRVFCTLPATGEKACVAAAARM